MSIDPRQAASTCSTEEVRSKMLAPANNTSGSRLRTDSVANHSKKDNQSALEALSPRGPTENRELPRRTACSKRPPAWSVSCWRGSRPPPGGLIPVCLMGTVGFWDTRARGPLGFRALQLGFRALQRLSLNPNQTLEPHQEKQPSQVGICP